MSTIPMLCAQVSLGSYTVVQIALTIVVLAAVCALLKIALTTYGVEIPPFVLQAFWIVVVAVVIIVAILFLARIAGFG